MTTARPSGHTSAHRALSACMRTGSAVGGCLLACCFVACQPRVTEATGSGSAPAADSASGTATAVFPASAVPGWTLTGDASAGPIDVQAVAGQPFDTAYVVTVAEVTDPIWGVALASPALPIAVDSGQVLHGHFYLRADFDGLQNESNTGNFEAYLQSTDQGWEGLTNFSGQPGPVWRKTYFTARAARDFPEGAVNLSLHLGASTQRVSIGGLQVSLLDASTDVAALPINVLDYEGRELDAAWRTEAFERIDRLRRGDLVVSVVAADGSPMGGVPVEFQLLNRDFHLGTVAHHPAEFDAPADYQRWRDTTARYFDALTCKMYPTDEWGWQNPLQRSRDIATVDWAIAEGYTVRGHVLVWPGWRWSPRAWRHLAEAGQGDTLRARVEAHVREVADSLSRRRADVVDVLNEPRVNHDVDDAVGAPSPRPDWFKAVHAAAPNVRLAINEFGIVSGFGANEGNLDAYVAAIRDILAADGQIDVIGVQGHMGEGFTHPERVWEIFDRLAAFGKPLHVTEFDVATDDDAVQGDYTRDFLTAALAHPAVEQVTLWGYWAPKHWRPAGALWAADWGRLPAGDALAAWVAETWPERTTVLTDADGRATFRGMAGAYRVTVPSGNTQVRLRVGEQASVRLVSK